MESITLERLLAARDRRAEKQRMLLKAFAGTALLCLTVNVPGPVKRLPEADRVFAAGVCALETALTGFPVLHREQVDAPTGLEGYWVLAADAAALKRVCCALEESLTYGRLLDVDVLGPDGVPLSRTALGYPARGCLVCGRAGASCYSRRLHPQNEVLAAFAALAGSAPEEDI